MWKVCTLYSVLCSLYFRISAFIFKNFSRRWHVKMFNFPKVLVEKKIIHRHFSKWKGLGLISTWIFVSSRGVHYRPRIGEDGLVFERQNKLLNKLHKMTNLFLGIFLDIFTRRSQCEVRTRDNLLIPSSIPHLTLLEENKFYAKPRICSVRRPAYFLSTFSRNAFNHVPSKRKMAPTYPRVIRKKNQFHQI